MFYVPRLVFVIAGLAALAMAIAEARRVRGGDQGARLWFAGYVASAAIFTIIVVRMHMEHRA